MKTKSMTRSANSTAIFAYLESGSRLIFLCVDSFHTYQKINVKLNNKQNKYLLQNCNLLLECIVLPFPRILKVMRIKFINNMEEYSHAD